MVQEEAQVPPWIDKLADALGYAIEIDGLGHLAVRYLIPDRSESGNQWEVLTLAPGVLEIEEQGPEDGQEIYWTMSRLDLLLLQAAFSKIDELALELDSLNPAHLAVIVHGEVEGHRVSVEIQSYPFEEEDPMSIEWCWEPKEGGAE